MFRAIAGPGPAPAHQGAPPQAMSALRRVVPAVWEGAPLNWRPSAHAVAGEGPRMPPVTTICRRCRRAGTAAGAPGGARGRTRSVAKAVPCLDSLAAPVGTPPLTRIAQQLARSL